MERWVFKYRGYTIAVAFNGILYRGRAILGEYYADTDAYTTFNEAKDSAMEIIKKAGVKVG